MSKIAEDSESDYAPELSDRSTTDSEIEYDISCSVPLKAKHYYHERAQRKPETVPHFIETLSIDEFLEIAMTIQEMTDGYCQDHVLQMADPTFHPTLVEDITEILIEQWTDAGICDAEEDYDDVRDFIENTVEDYFDMSSGNQPMRSRKTATVFRGPSEDDIHDLSRKIAKLQAIEQPAQRTEEWYEFRRGLITASNLSKVFGSEALRNSLIFEKCRPFEPFTSGSGYVNTESPMHWGQKYEPVSRMIYEDMYGTRVSDEFGCIRHPHVPCIGASPDGINVDPLSERFGRMVEIKNVVNRELDGIPSKAYWIQMQIQMETCDLDECDFLETQICECKEGEEEFWEKTGDYEYRGVVLYFVERVSIGIPNIGTGTGSPSSSGMRLRSNSLINQVEPFADGAFTGAPNNAPHYEYMPLTVPLTKEAVEEWIGSTRQRLRRQWSLYTTLWWYMADYSCILVERNRSWFEAARPMIENTWTTILKERETGYEHRSAKKRSVKDNGAGTSGTLMVVKEGSSPVTNSFTLSTGSVCLVKLE